MNIGCWAYLLPPLCFSLRFFFSQFSVSPTISSYLVLVFITFSPFFLLSFSFFCPTSVCLRLSCVSKGILCLCWEFINVLLTSHDTQSCNVSGVNWWNMFLIWKDFMNLLLLQGMLKKPLSLTDLLGNVLIHKEGRVLSCLC